jgi:hypothetical protein
MQVDFKDKGQGGEMLVGHLKQIFNLTAQHKAMHC